MENQQKETETTEKTEPTTDSGTGNKPEATGILAEVRKEREELVREREAANKAISELKELKAIEVLGGGSEAGSVPAEKKEETPKEYKDRILRNELNG